MTASPDWLAFDTFRAVRICRWMLPIPIKGASQHFRAANLYLIIMRMDFGPEENCIMFLRNLRKLAALLDKAAGLRQEQFSSPLLGRIYGQVMARHGAGLEVSAGVLEDLSGEEMSHLTGILHRQQGPVNEDAFMDCVRTIQAEHRAANVATEDDLLALRNRLKERKGIDR